MGKQTSISWTDHTFNPWWGCQKVSPGCEQCYAETFSKRVGQKVWGPTAERRFFGDTHWNEPLKWNRDAEKSGMKRRVFCASMADWLEDRRDLDAQRERLFGLIVATPMLTWQLLTKRPENFAKLLSPRFGLQLNVEIGVTAENQKQWRERVPLLQDYPARRRFVSVEPMLEEVRPLFVDGLGIHWLIIGGESGAHARPFRFEWARSLLAYCREAHIAPFVKQIGSNPEGEGQRLIKQGKGDDPSYWPADLRIQELRADD